MIRDVTDFLVPNEIKRHEWVAANLKNLERGSKVLDVGCGTQRYKSDCLHLDYYGQDFGEYSADKNDSGLQNIDWDYGEINYKGNCWDIKEQDSFFDTILCTEVLEHIPYPNETILEISRLLKPNGNLILTAPYACLPHMQPYFYYSGFSREWYNYILEKYGLEIIEITPNGNLYMFLLQENIRSIKLIKGFFLKLVSMFFASPKIIFDLIMSRISKDDQLVFGYHIRARKKTSKK